MNYLKIAEQIFKQKNIADILKDQLEIDFFNSDISSQDIYKIYKFLNVGENEDAIISLTDQSIPKKLQEIIFDLRKISPNVHNVIVCSNQQKKYHAFLVSFLLVNGQNGGNGIHECYKSLEEISNIINFLDKKQLEDNIDLLPNIRHYQGDITDSVYYWVIEFWF